MELLLDRAETLVQLLKTRYPNLPQTFLDATKIQYGKVCYMLNDMMHSNNTLIDQKTARGQEASKDYKFLLA